MTAARFGPRLKPQGGVTFRLWAPAAKRVDLLLADVYPMRAEPHGWFEATLPEAGPGTRYRFRIDGGLIVAFAFLIQILSVIGRFKPAGQPFPPLSKSTIDDVHNIGSLLFSNYNLPFQIIGVVVLVATIGVVVLSKRELR